MSDSVVAADEAGRIVWLNAAAERLVGVRAAELIGQPVDTLTATRAGRTVPLAVGSIRELTVFPPAFEPHESPRATAHDFNNVFSVVRTYASFILDNASQATEVDRSERWTSVQRDAETIIEAVNEGVALCRRLVEEEPG
jgi:hypothetical protein